jgi:hypothetical protein
MLLRRLGLTSSAWRRKHRGDIASATPWSVVSNFVQTRTARRAHPFRIKPPSQGESVPKHVGTTEKGIAGSESIGGSPPRLSPRAPGRRGRQLRPAITFGALRHPRTFPPSREPRLGQANRTASTKPLPPIRRLGRCRHQALDGMSP